MKILMSLQAGIRVMILGIAMSILPAVTATATLATSSAVPLPVAAWLLGSALADLAVVRRRNPGKVSEHRRPSHLA